MAAFFIWGSAIVSEKCQKSKQKKNCSMTIACNIKTIKPIDMKKIFLALMIACSVPVALKAQQGFHVIQTFHIQSPGGWDYIAVGPENNRLYVSHSSQVNILDESTGDSIGVIENTAGVHGIAFDRSLGKGYTSNGRL